VPLLPAPDPVAGKGVGTRWDSTDSTALSMTALRGTTQQTSHSRPSPCPTRFPKRNETTYEGTSNTQLRTIVKKLLE